MVNPSSQKAPMIATPDRVLAKIKTLRLRRRRLRASDGLLRLTTLAFILIWGLFLLDWSLDLPIAVRAFQLLAAATMLFLGLRIFVLSARRPVSDSWLTSQVERHENLDQALLTAVQLASGDNPRAQFYSPMLLNKTIREAEQRIEQIDTANIVSRRGVFTTFFLLCLFIGPAVAGVLLYPKLADTFVQRNLLFGEIPWPRNYDLKVLEPVEHETMLAMGDAFLVQIYKETGGSARANIQVLFSDGLEENFTMEKKGARTYRQLFRNVIRDFTFKIECGDWRSSEYRVRVRNRPRIQEIHLEFDYPDYTGLDAVEATDSASSRSLGGHLKVPIGTEVSFRAVTSISVSRAIWVEEFRVGGEAGKEERELEVASDKELTGVFSAQRNGSYHFRLVSEDGFENPTPIRYQIAVVADEPPMVQIDRPGKNTEVSAEAAFPVVIQASDDYGLLDVQFVLQLEEVEGEVAEGEIQIRRSLPELLEGSELKQTTLDLDLSTSLTELRGVLQGRLKLEPGRRLEYFVEAKDARGQIGVSRTYLLTLVDADELTRILQDELALVTESLEQTLEVQRDSRKEIVDLLMKLTGSSLLASDLPALRQARLQQERVLTRVEESTARLTELVQRVISNRLNWKELPRINSIHERLRTVQDDFAPKALQQVNALLQKSSEGHGQSQDLVASSERQQRVERALVDILVDLREWGDLNSVTQKLEEAISRQKELYDRVREKLQGQR